MTPATARGKTAGMEHKNMDRLKVGFGAALMLLSAVASGDEGCVFDTVAQPPTRDGTLLTSAGRRYQSAGRDRSNDGRWRRGESLMICALNSEPGAAAGTMFRIQNLSRQEQLIVRAANPH